jgi:hypothetical protein
MARYKTPVGMPTLACGRRNLRAFSKAEREELLRLVHEQIREGYGEDWEFRFEGGRYCFRGHDDVLEWLLRCMRTLV